MSREIWKYSLTEGSNDLLVPRGAQFLDVQNQSNDVVVWALVDPDAETVGASVRLIMTGEQFEAKGYYVGTVQIGILVFHAFALVES